MSSSLTALSSSGIKITHRSSAPVLAAQSQLFHHQVHDNPIPTHQDDEDILATAASKTAVPNSAIQPTLPASFLFSSSRRKARRTSSAVESQTCRRRCVGATQTPAAVANGEPEKSRWLQRIEKGVVKFITAFCR